MDNNQKGENKADKLKATIPEKTESFVSYPFGIENPKLPPSILSRAGHENDTFLHVGCMSVLSGDGGLGKSSVAAGIAVGRATGKTEACGFSITRGNTMLAFMEQGAEYTADQIQKIARANGVSKFGKLARNVPHWSGSPVIWEPENGRNDYWDVFWNTAREHECDLIVMDPVAQLYGGSMNDMSEVLGFLGAIHEEIKETNVGVLMVTHPTKEGVNRVIKGENPGAQAIHGSSVWFTRPRGVVLLFQDPKDEKFERKIELEGKTPEEKRIVLRSVKNNIGNFGWYVNLSRDPSDFGGFSTDLLYRDYEADNAAYQNLKKGKVRRDVPSKDFEGI